MLPLEPKMGSKLMLVLVYLCFQQVLGFYINDTRIHYGKPTKIEEIPYQAAMLVRGRQICGGSILTKQHILTAGHCVEKQNIREVQFSLGSNGPSDKRGVIMNVKQIVMHPQYSLKPLLVYDVAVAVLASFINFNERIQPIKLPNRQPTPGTVVLASGWGETETSYPGQGSNVLMAVETRVASPQECAQLVYPHNTYFCTTIAKQGPCHGDSGGPLANRASREVIGITSFGTPFCTGNPGRYGSFFSNVYYLRPFIDKILQQHKNSTQN